MLKEMNIMSDLAELILITLRKRGDWMTRMEIAKEMQRPGRMPPYDIQLLNKLVEDGLVESEQRLTGVAHRTWVYRAKSSN